MALLIAATLAANGGKYFRCLGTLVSRESAEELEAKSGKRGKCQLSAAEFKSKLLLLVVA